MAIIEPKGLFAGDRLSRCSDEAQLHWVRLYSAANGFARLELNYRKLIAVAYSGFKRPPTETKFWAWIQEYRENFLLFVYRAPSGIVWGQWSTDVRHLPRYKSAEDKHSPSPPPKELKEFEIGYSKWKQMSERAPRKSHGDIYGELLSVWKDMLTKRVHPTIRVFAFWVEHYSLDDIHQSIYIAGQRYRDKPFGTNEFDECAALIPYVGAILRNRKEGVNCESSDSANRGKKWKQKR